MDPGFEVVISGISGVYPASGTTDELAQNLYNGKNLISLDSKRWKKDNKYNVKPTAGTVPGGIGVFDAQFFTTNAKLSSVTSGMTKLATERSFEAVIDAGLSPQSLKGSNTQVYTTTSMCIYEAVWADEHTKEENNYSIMGRARTMCANRISYYLDLKGKSAFYDGSWSSAQTAIQAASDDILRGEADAALILGGNIVEVPEINFMYRDFGLISDNGICKSFDENANGGQRSDACVCIFLQRSDQAKRVYARVVDCRADFLSSPFRLDPVIAPPGEAIENYLAEIYRNCGKDPRDLVYLESDGSGCKQREENELNAEGIVLCKDRTVDNPLLVGSVKSNLGFTDNCSGMVAMAKVLLAMEKGIVPGNVNFTKANPYIKPLVDGRMKVVTSNTPLNITDKSLFATTTLALSSIVGHAIFQPMTKVKKSVDVNKELPRLVFVAGRTEEGIQSALLQIQQTAFDPEFIRLTQDAFSDDFRGLNYKGYTVLPITDHVKMDIRQAHSRPPVWFVYSGMGSQWAGMGEQLMQFPIFAETIDRLHQVLLPKGLDLKTIITETGPTAFDTIMKCFVGITAVQIGLTNMLTALGLKPDGIIGHSLGEIGCSYADGCLTEEQTMLVGWARGQAAMDADLIDGLMAAIGMGYNEMKEMLPPSIDVACHNSSTSCTISGPREDVEQFVEKLTADGVFARTVNTGKIAFHSRYVQKAGALLLQNLTEVIPDPKPRSAIWHSSSYPQDQWETPEAKLCSAEYQTNNLLSSVLFEEVLTVVPPGAVLLEIAPHGLMQPILKRALPDNPSVSLTHRTSKSPVHFFLQSLGELYVTGVSTKIAALYPEVEFPVSRGTPRLSHLTSWSHTEHPSAPPFGGRPQNLRVHYNDPYVLTTIGELVPVSGLTSLMWESILRFLEGQDFHVVFQNMQIRKKLLIPAVGMKKLKSHHMAGTGRIETIDNEKDVVIIGNISRVTEKSTETPKIQEPENVILEISGDKMYNELVSAGINYSPLCRGVKKISVTDEDWIVEVTSNFGTPIIIDSLIQILQYRNLQKCLPFEYPKFIRKLEIDPSEISSTTNTMLVKYKPFAGIVYGPGVYLDGVEFGNLKSESLMRETFPLLDDVVISKWGLNPLDQSVSMDEQISCGQLDFVGFDKNQERVMGIACRNESGQIILNPLLRWSVPSSWTDDQAVSVPFAYCLAVYALEVCCGIHQRDAVLIHDGMSAVGQAAIRVALQYNCRILLITVKNDHEKKTLLNNFCELNCGNILPLETFELTIYTEKKYPRIILNGLPGETLKASVRCSSQGTKIVHYGRQDGINRRHIGTLTFLRSMALFGLTGDFLFRARDFEKKAMIQSITEKLRDGVICPLIGFQTKKRPSNSVLPSSEIIPKRIIDNNQSTLNYVKQCTSDKTYVVVGGSEPEWLQVVGNLAKIGATNIVAVGTDNTGSSQFVQERLKALKQTFVTNVTTISGNLKEAMDKAKKIASVDAVIIITQDSSIENIWAEQLMNSKAGVLFLLTSRSQDSLPFVKYCRDRRLRSAVIQGPVFRAASLLPKFLAGGMSPYIPLFTASDEQTTKGNLHKCLPNSPESLSDLVTAFPAVPRIQELPSNGLRLRHSKEVFPIFVLPPLGVLQESEREGVLALARKQHQPVVLVELPPGGTIMQRSKVVVDEIHRLRPVGPYNVLGWGLSNPLALQVTRDLEESGHRAVTFLIDGDVERVKDWASSMVNDAEGEVTLLCHLLQQESKYLPLQQELQAARTWTERVHITVSSLISSAAEKTKIETGLHVLRSYIKELSKHKLNLEPLQGRINVITSLKLEPSCFSLTNANIIFTVVSDIELDSAELAQLVNAQSAWSRLTSEQDIRNVQLNERPRLLVN